MNIKLSQPDQLQEQIKLGTIKFTETRGGTELGVRLDPKSVDQQFQVRVYDEGSVVWQGTVIEGGQKGPCSIELDLATGKGKLTLL